MISRNALYTFIETQIEAAGSGDVLFEAVSFRNVRSPIDQASKVVRVEVFGGEHCMTTEAKRKELHVKATIQCWVTPDGVEQDSMDIATDLSFDMSRAIFVAAAGDTSLGGVVCDSYFSEFETGEANLGATRRGVTYLDGIINQAS